MHCDDVSAYDFRFDFTDGGNGNVSIAYTLVLRTIVRQHNSCSDKTEKRKQFKYIEMWARNIKYCVKMVR